MVLDKSKRDMFKKLISNGIDKLADNKEVIIEKAKPTIITKLIDGSTGITPPTQQIIKDMVDLGDNGANIVKRRSVLGKIKERLIPRQVPKALKNYKEIVDNLPKFTYIDKITKF